MAFHRRRRSVNTIKEIIAIPATAEPTLIPAMAPLLSPELPELLLVDVAAEVELLVVVLDAQILPRHW